MPFENILNLQIRAFFFNSATDYLPYYKNFDITIDRGATLLDIMHKVKTLNPNFSFPNENIILKVNDKITTAETLVEDIIESMGNELQIDPANSYRSINGLILNDDDFMESFELLAPYATNEDRELYKKLYTLHYASETSLYNRQYIGDAILVLASKMIADGNEHKEKILEAISDEFNGIRCCEYENNIFKGVDYSEIIANLKNMINLKDTISKCDTISFKKKEHNVETVEGSNIALYVGDKNSHKIIEQTQELIEGIGAKFIEFKLSTKLAGQTLMNTNFEMAHIKAGTMLLEALDSGADILVCAKDDDVTTFQKAIVHAERIMGRDIELKIISMNSLEELCELVA